MMTILIMIMLMLMVMIMIIIVMMEITKLTITQLIFNLGSPDSVW